MPLVLHTPQIYSSDVILGHATTNRLWKSVEMVLTLRHNETCELVLESDFARYGATA